MLIITFDILSFRLSVGLNRIYYEINFKFLFVNINKSLNTTAVLHIIYLSFKWYF